MFLIIIKKDLLNKIASFDFRDLNAEMDYTLKLANEGIKIAFAFGYASAKKGKMLNIFKKKKSVKEMEKMKDDLKKKFNF